MDLVVAWEVLDPVGRAAFRDALDVDELARRRGMGWALFIGVMTFPYDGDTMPGRCADRLGMVRQVLAADGWNPGPVSA